MSLEGLLITLALVAIGVWAKWAKTRGSTRSTKLPKMMDEREIEELRQVAQAQGERSRAFDVKLAAGVHERKRQRAIDLATRDSALWLARIKAVVAHGGTRVSISGEPSWDDESGRERWPGVQRRTNFIPTEAAHLEEEFLDVYTNVLRGILKEPFGVVWTKDENGRFYGTEWEGNGTYRYKISVIW
jgi:hypothetical protein